MFSKEVIKSMIISMLNDVDKYSIKVNGNYVEIEGSSSTNKVELYLTMDNTNNIQQTLIKDVVPVYEQTPVIQSTPLPKGTDLYEVTSARKLEKEERIKIIKKMIEVEGLSQTEVGRRLGYSQSRISSLLRGE